MGPKPQRGHRGAWGSWPATGSASASGSGRGMGRSGEPCGPGAIQQGFSGGTEQAVGAHLGEAPGQDVLQEAGDEAAGLQGAVVDPAGAVVAVAEGDEAVLEALEAAVDQGDTIDVAGEVAEDGLTGAGVLEVDDPALAPDVRGNLVVEAGLAEGSAQLGAEEDGQSPARDEEVGSPGGDPAGRGPVAPSPGGDQEVNVGVVEQGPRPGVQDSETAGPGAEVAGVGGELEEGLSGRGHQQAVDDLLMRAGEAAQLGGQREGDEEVGAGQQARALALQPPAGLVGVALGAVPVAAGVVAVLPGATVITGSEVSAEGGGAAGLDVAHGLAVRGQQARSAGLAVDRSGVAEDVRQLQHEGTGGSEALHQAVDGIAGGLVDLLGEVGVDLGGSDAGMAEVDLDDAGIRVVFEQVSRVGMSQGVHVSALVNATELEGAAEGALEAGAGDGAGAGRDEVARPTPEVSGEQPLGRAMGAPVLSEDVEGLDGQGDVAVLAGLAVDVKEHPAAVDVGDLKVSAFKQPQAAGVDGDQTGAVDGQANAVQDPLDLLAAQNHGELVLALGADEAEQLPVPPQAALEEELDAAQRDGEAGGGELLDVGEVEEVLPELALGDPVGRLAEVSGELPAAWT